MTDTRHYDILVVEDDNDIRRLLAMLLRQRGYQVREAATGQEALLGARDHVPDLVLLDLNLPEVDGWEVCRRLRADEATVRVPVIIMTAAYLSFDEARAGLALGADEYVTKPFIRDVLLHNVARWLGKTHPIAEAVPPSPSA